tara:strand:- start:29895 stop:30221 length:327 start_codon:yes stop_codon:yes gene_type:complete
MATSDIRKRALVEALEKSLGVVTVACKNVGISRETYYKYLREDDEFRAKVEDVENIALDFVESKLHTQISGDNITAIIFYLKTKGKKRGYIERTEHSFNKDVNISFED